MAHIRLNKVLRELNISLEKAFDYLQAKGIEIEKRPTAKITEEAYRVLINEFNVDSIKRIEPKNIEENNHRAKEMINYSDQIINNYKTLIVTSGNDSGNPEKGYPKPQCSYINDYKVIRINKLLRDEYFPNSGHLITLSNYTRDIRERFEPTEFFKIRYQNSKSFFSEDSYSVKYEVVNQSIEKLPLLIDDDISLILAKGEIDLPYKYHSYTYIRTDSKIYGPIAIVDVTEEEGIDTGGLLYKYKIQSLLTISLNLEKDFEDVIHVFDEKEIEEFIITNNYGKNSSDEYYVTNTLELLKKAIPIELILNEDIDKTIKIIEEKSLPSKDKNIVVANLNEANKIRFEKYIESKSKSEIWMSFLKNKIFSEYFDTHEGKVYIEEYIENNKEEIIESKIKELKYEAETKVSEQIANLEKEKEKILTSINDALNEKQNLTLRLEDLSNEIEIVKQKNQELTEVEDEIKQKKKELNLYHNIEEIKIEKDNYIKQKDEVYTEISNLINDKERYNKELEDVKDELRNGTKEIVERRYKEIKPYFDLMSGKSEDVIKKTENYPSIIKNIEDIKFNTSEITIENLQILIEDLDKFLQSRGRRYKQEEILNFVILYFQNFLIIFSGSPGIGKTSLSSLISEFFTPKSCFLELAVSKGWNSRKILLGYNNPINNTYQYDEFGFVKTIISFNKNNLNLPLNILLDEANLSPIEYYWSDFISIYDKDKTEKTLKLDLENYNNLKIPSQLRFIATINNDHTTERLSPRLIDRAPVIILENDNLRLFDNQNKTDYSFEGYYSFNQLDDLLNPVEALLLSKEKEILIEVLNILKEDGSIIVSIRKMNSIKKYCSISRELMSKYTSNQYAHIDYSIAQYILPKIQGQGKSFEIMLEKLLELFKDNQLSKSVKILKKIKENGTNFQVFSFF